MDEFAGLKRKSKKSRAQPDDIVLPGAEDLERKDADAISAAKAPSAAPVEDAVRPLEADANLTLPEDQPLDFSDLKKKARSLQPLTAAHATQKKSKKVALDLDDVASPGEPVSTEPAAPLAGDDAPMDDFSDLKKKKKKKVTIDDDALPAEPAADGVDGEFADLKKKKKSKKAFDMAEFERELAATDDGVDDGVDAGGEVEPEGENPFAADDDEASAGKSEAERAADRKAWLKEPSRDYQYIELLGRFFTLLQESHPSLGAGARKKQSIPPPAMHRDGNKRTVFSNVADICKKMRRTPEHVIQFLLAELGTTGSVDGSQRLVIKGRFQSKQIENVLRHYIIEYVTCKTCKSPDTEIAKENRLYFVNCNTCGSHRSVQTIQAGFKAQIAKRKALAAKAG